MFRPPNYKLPIQASYHNNVCTEYEHKLKTELIKQSKPNKITTIVEIKWQRLRKRDANTRTIQQCVIKE